MGRAPVASKVPDGGLNKGPWTEEEDAILTAFIKAHGEGNWRTLPKLAGLQRCRKSCRLRWMNYLRPDLKRGNFSPDEDELIVKLHALLGNRWSLIAGRIPGRTDNEIKNYWNSRLRRKLSMEGKRVEAKPLSCSDLTEVEAKPLSCSDITEVVASPITVCEPATPDSSSFPDYPEAFDSPLFASEPYARFDNGATPSSTEPCSSSDATACLDDCLNYSSSYSLDEVAKHEHAHSPESVLAQIDFDTGDDFYGYDFTNGLADLGDTVNFQKLLLSPLHKNPMATAGWSSWPSFCTSDYGFQATMSM